MQLNYQRYLIILLLILPSTILQASEITMEHLSSNSKKTWIVEAIDLSLGKDKTCTKGIEYTFQTNHTLKVESCINFSIKTKTHSWTKKFDGIDTYLTIDTNQTYRLIYSEKINDIGMKEEELVLRMEETKETPTQDIIMSHIP